MTPPLLASTWAAHITAAAADIYRGVAETEIEKIPWHTANR
jgi:hypothetical protein